MCRPDSVFPAASLCLLAGALLAMPQGTGNRDAVRRGCRPTLAFEDRRADGTGLDFLALGAGCALHLSAASSVARLAVAGGQPVVLRSELVGGDPAAAVATIDPLAAKVSYLLGNDRSAWRTGIGLWGRVRYESSTTAARANSSTTSSWRPRSRPT
jgi:hypothetical protein